LGFTFAVNLRDEEWSKRGEEEFVQMVIVVLMVLSGHTEGIVEQIPVRLRSELADALPTVVRWTYHFWHGLRDQFERRFLTNFDRKIGRNEPCPCRSSKKYKRCCGSVEMRARDEPLKRVFEQLPSTR
jgi:uncharacterized protein YecA (UPF0149 family)